MGQSQGKRFGESTGEVRLSSYGTTIEGSGMRPNVGSGECREGWRDLWPGYYICERRGGQWCYGWLVG